MGVYRKGAAPISGGTRHTGSFSDWQRKQSIVSVQVNGPSRGLAADGGMQDARGNTK